MPTHSNPSIVIFWSYKGGQGRTWACANIALDLALNQGGRVLVIDFDYRAPGMHLFFQPLTEIALSQAPFGFVEGLLRWHITYDKSYQLERSIAKIDYSSSDSLTELIRKYRVPDKTHDRFSLLGDDWEVKGVEQHGKQGGLLDVLHPIDLLKAKTLGAKSKNTGSLHIAPCGDVQDPMFRDYFGEGYAWRLLADPRSRGQNERTPLTFADAFYSVAAHLARKCQAEFVFIDLPAGVSNLGSQLISPTFGDHATCARFRHSAAPSGLIAVTSLSHQSLEGSAALFQGALTDDSSGSFIPEVVTQKRATVLYNLLNVHQTAMADLIGKHSERTGIPIEFENGLPVGGFLEHGDLAFSEWLVPLSEIRHSYASSPPAPRSWLDPMRNKTNPVLEVWTGTRPGALGLVPRLHRRGQFHAEPSGMDVPAPSTLRLVAEDVPTAKAFIDQLLEDSLPGLERIELRCFEHPDLFDGLLVDNDTETLVKGFRQDCGLSESRHKPSFPVKVHRRRVGGEPHGGEETIERLSFDDLCGQAHAIAIPHYLLGHFFESAQGIADLGEVLGGERRQTVENQVTRFEELCCYRNVWCAFPFALLAKLVFCRKQLPRRRRRFRDLKEDAEVDDESQPWILTESKADSLSLWYEWEQILVSTGGKLLSRSQGSDVAQLVARTESEPVYQCIRLYWELIRSQDPKDIGVTDWTNSLDRFRTTESYKFWLGWNDWAHGVKGEGDKAGFISFPLDEITSPRQPLEAWIWVIPRTDQTQSEVKATACAIYRTMSYEWQRAFQERGGSTALHKVLTDPELERRQPWLSLVVEAVVHAVTKGATPTVPYYAKVIVAFLTYVLYKGPETPELPGSEDELRQRFDDKWDGFHNVLSQLRDRELRR